MIAAYSLIVQIMTLSTGVLKLSTAMLSLSSGITRLSKTLAEAVTGAPWLLPGRRRLDPSVRDLKGIRGR